MEIHENNYPLVRAARRHVYDNPGDFNGDGFVSLMDVLHMKKYVAGSLSVGWIAFSNGDLDHDGAVKVNLKDIKAFKRIIAG